MASRKEKLKIRPVDKFTYYALAKLAIESYPKKEACILMIYSYLSVMFPSTFRADNKKTWQSTVRTTLCRYKEFSRNTKGRGGSQNNWIFRETAEVNGRIKQLHELLGINDE